MFLLVVLTDGFPPCSMEPGDSGSFSYAKGQVRERQEPAEMECYALVDTAEVPSLALKGQQRPRKGGEKKIHDRPLGPRDSPYLAAM